jgi:hypothetical protein
MKTSNQSKRYLAFLLLRPSLGLALTLLGVLLLVWTSSPISTAKEKLTMAEGTKLCCDNCKQINKTQNSQDTCCANCIVYWSKYGSDSKATVPNSTPTPTPSRKYPIKGPPHRLGPNPSPSATAKPILLAKPKPTPSPKPTPKRSSHGHH